MPFPRIGTVEPSHENEMDISGVRDKIVMKRRVRLFWSFQISNFRFSADNFREMRERPFWTKKEKKNRTNEDADKISCEEKKRKTNRVADEKKVGFSGTAGADQYRPVPRDWRDKSVISGEERNWKSGARRLCELWNLLFSCCYPLTSWINSNFTYNFRAWVARKRKKSIQLQWI